MAASTAVKVTFTRPSLPDAAAAGPSGAESPETRTLEFPLDAARAQPDALVAALETAQAELNSLLTAEMARDKDALARTEQQAAAEVDEEELYDEDEPDDDIS